MNTEHSEYDRDTFEDGGIIWGGKIDASNDGKPLPLLKDDDMVFCYWGEEIYGGPYPVHCVHGWGEGFQIRLPADHPYYHAFNPAPAPISVDEPISTLEHAPKTLRDEFAMAALAGIAADHYPDSAAVLAYEYADAMMDARK